MAKQEERSASFRAPTGTRDILPPESARWESLIGTFAQLAHRSGYGLVLPPLFEDVGVFARGVGNSTDIVVKEMYEFEDRGGRRVALRPEATASVARSFVEHRPATLPWKVFYGGPMFRYERPQAGRYRQFYQLGAEAIGTEDPEIDIEMVAFAWDFFEAVGVRKKALRINSLGDSACRPDYRAELGAYLSKHESELCQDHRTRYSDNPMRVLDCKKTPCIDATREAPHQVDHLCGSCEDAIRRVSQGLEDLGIPFTLDARLVRGLDYYTRTTFEIAATALDAAQNAVGGGGRYDGLVERLGGPPTPAVGFSVGVERTLAAAERGEGQGEGTGLEIYVVEMPGRSQGRQSTLIARELRQAGLKCERDFGMRSAKAQFRAADRSGARLAVVIGEEELQAGVVSLKDLRAETTQHRVLRKAMIEEIRRMLS